MAVNMKKPFRIGSFAGLAALGLVQALQAAPPVESGTPAQWDANGDGAVSLEEYVAQAVAAAKVEFKKLDADGSGVLQGPELAASATVPSRAAKEPGEPGLLRRASQEDPQRDALRKRISPGPSMRQGGR